MKQTKLILFSGYLGSGKETMLKNVIKAHHERMGILTLKLPGVMKTMEDTDETPLTLIELNDGIVYCNAQKERYVDALIEMHSYDLDYLLVETTGYTTPAQFKEALECVEHVTDDLYTYLGSVYLMDAQRILKDHEINQTLHHGHLACSDLVVVNKVDLVEELELAKVIDYVEAEAPGVEILESVYCDLDILNVAERIKKSKLLKLAETFNTADRRSHAILLSFVGEVPLDQFKAFMEDIGIWTLRSKGFVLTENGIWHVDHSTCEFKLEAFTNQDSKPRSTLTIMAPLGTCAIAMVSQAFKKRFENDFSIEYKQ